MPDIDTVEVTRFPDNYDPIGITASHQQQQSN
jgi:hypothetical protein